MARPAYNVPHNVYHFGLRKRQTTTTEGDLEEARRGPRAVSFWMQSKAAIWLAGVVVGIEVWDQNDED